MGKNQEKDKEVVVDLVPVSTDTAISTFSMDDLEAAAGTGIVETLGIDDLTIPRIGIIQASSDELKPKHAKYIPGAKIGDLFNSLTKELFDGEKGIFIIPCHHHRDIREWFSKRVVNRYPIDHAFQGHPGKTNGKGTWITVDGPAGPEEHEMVETREFFALHLREDGDIRRITVVMKKTALKVGKAFNSMIRDIRVPGSKGNRFNPPSHGQIYNMHVVSETSTNNEDYLNFAVKFASVVTDGGVFAAAKKYFEDASKGTVKVQEDESDSTAGDTGGSSEEIPFNVGNEPGDSAF